MNLTTTLFAAFALLLHPKEDSDCHEAYQDATYGFQHAETAMESNNLAQLKEYAERSEIAIKKVMTATEKCGCTDANYASYDALENLDKALEKEKFESVRMFVNRAKTNAKEIIIALDVCNSKDPAIILKENESDLLAQEQELLEQQQQLLAQQKKLEMQLKEQKELQKQISQQKEQILAQQKLLKADAESSLKELETLMNRFTSAMGYEGTTPLTQEPFERTVEDLESESLKATKLFYLNKAREMANNLLNTLDRCE
ncbi:MAG: hypothetical protein AAFP76_00555 [Bacteroidota bacterium]